MSAIATSLEARALEKRGGDPFEARPIKKHLGGLAPTEAIEGFFMEIVEGSIADKARRGCMLVNTGLDIAPHDPEFRKIVAREFSSNEEFFRSRIEAGQTSGALRPDVPAGTRSETKTVWFPRSANDNNAAFI